MFTLTQYQINRIKVYMQMQYDLFIEDITDAEVFDFINDKYNDGVEFSVNTKGSISVEDWEYDEPPTKQQIAGDIVSMSYGEGNYTSFI